MAKRIIIYSANNNWWIRDDEDNFYDCSGNINTEMTYGEFFWPRQPISLSGKSGDLYSKEEYNKYYNNTLRVAIARCKKNFTNCIIVARVGTTTKKYQWRTS